MGRAPLLAVALLALPVGGCAGNVVLSPDARAVQTDAGPRLTWRAARAEDLVGFWESTSIEGASAGAVLRAYTWYGRDGGYSSAALIQGEVGPRFQVLADDGRYSLDAAGLDLHDGGPPLQAWVATDHLRLVAPDATMTFRKVAVE